MKKVTSIMLRQYAFGAGNVYALTEDGGLLTAPLNANGTFEANPEGEEWALVQDPGDSREANAALLELGAEPLFKRAHEALIAEIDRALTHRLSYYESTDEKVKYLTDVIAGNRSSWSGGPHNPTNIVERLWHDAAIKRMQALAWSIGRAKA